MFNSSTIVETSPSFVRINSATTPNQDFAAGIQPLLYEIGKILLCYKLAG
jgi:hypothetical protein